MDLTEREPWIQPFAFSVSLVFLALVSMYTQEQDHD